MMAIANPGRASTKLIELRAELFMSRDMARTARIIRMVSEGYGALLMLK